MSNLGRWDPWYERLSAVEPYGPNELTYALGAEWLLPCARVEDWGCGKGWFKSRYRPDCVALDGSCTPFADVVVDLASYRSDVDGVFMRHVLEHNEEWEAVLENALASCQRLFVAVYTPSASGGAAELVQRVGVLDVPELLLPHGRISELCGVEPIVVPGDGDGWKEWVWRTMTSRSSS